MKRTTMYLPAGLVATLEERARLNGLSRNDVVRILLEVAVNNDITLRK